MKFISDGCRAIAKAMIEHPEDWHQTTYTFACKSVPGFAIWTASGTAFLSVYGGVKFNFFERRYIRNAIQISLAKNAQQMARKALKSE